MAQVEGPARLGYSKRSTYLVVEQPLEDVTSHCWGYLSREMAACGNPGTRRQAELHGEIVPKLPSPVSPADITSCLGTPCPELQTAPNNASLRACARAAIPFCKMGPHVPGCRKGV
jgi:hypothetical protein